MPVHNKIPDAKISLNPRFLDFANIQDDKRVLENPHKGWYYHYVDNGFSDIRYRKDLENADRLPAKGIHHLYIRFDWTDIEKADGVFDWRPIDEIIERFAGNGYKFSLRLCTFESVCSIASSRPVRAFPGFLGIPETPCDRGGKIFYEPDYGSGIFFKYLERFMKEYGARYNGNPLIEYVDIGTFGTWGEGHTEYGSWKLFGIDVLRKHIDLHLKYFPDTLVLINDDMINHLYRSDIDACSELYDYCLSRDMGLRDDSACVSFYSKPYGFSTLRSPRFFRQFAKNNPVDIEMSHYTALEKEAFGGGLRLIEALSEARATYAGFHGELGPWLEENSYLHDHIANQLGYWYFIDGIELPELVSGTACFADVWIKNKGFARAYHRYDLKLILKGENGEFTLNAESPDNRAWQEESEQRETVRLDLRGVPAGRYFLYVGMFENGTPIRLGFKEETEENGIYRVAEVTVSELL